MLALVVLQMCNAGGVGDIRNVPDSTPSVPESTPSVPDSTPSAVVLPASYMVPNWPIRCVALSPDSQDVAISGRRGVILHNLQTAKWRMFGDISQVSPEGVRIIFYIIFHTTTRVVEIAYRRFLTSREGR